MPRSLSAEQRRALRLLAESSAARAGVPQDALVRMHHFNVPVLKSLTYRGYISVRDRRHFFITAMGKAAIAAYVVDEVKEGL